MDPISYSVAAKQKERIERVIANPDTSSGVITTPKTIASGETITVPAGRVATLPNATVEGTLVVDGEVFIPSGSGISTTEVDATVVKQNGNVVANDTTVVHKTDDETIAGIKTFSSSPIVPIPTLLNQAISMGNIIEKTGAGIGYGTGSGGIVTQLTSKSTAVTLNKPSGQIIMNSAALASGASVTFQLNNSLYTYLEDYFDVFANGIYAPNYKVERYANSSGLQIKVTNTTAGSLSESPVLKFIITKGANA